MTDEEERAARYLESCRNRERFEAARRRGLRGSEGARKRVDEAWDALRGEPLYEPKRLSEARRLAERVGCEDAADEAA